MTAGTPSLLARWAGIVGWQGIGLMLTLGTMALAAGMIPPRVWGEYWLLYSVVQITSGLALSWVAQSTLYFAREEARATGSVHVTLSSAMGLDAAILALLCPVGLIIAWSLPAASGMPVWLPVLLLVGIAALAAYEVTTYALQAVDRFDGLGAGSAISKAGPLAGLALIAMGAPNEAGLLLGAQVIGLLAALAVIGSALPPPSGPRFAPSPELARRIAGYGARLPVGIAAGVLSAWMHVWFVRAFAGPEATGVYAWAAGIHAVLLSGLMPLSAVLAPRMIDLVQSRSAEAVGDRTALFTSIVLLVTAMAPLGFVALQIAGLALPARLAGAGPILLVLSSALPAALAANLASPILLAYPAMIGRIVRVNVLMAGANLGLNLALTPILGGLGAAIALSLAVWLGAEVLLRDAASLAPSPARSTRRHIAALPLAGLVLVAVALLLGHTAPAPAMALGVIAALAMTILLRELGALVPLGSLAHHVSNLPQPIERPLTRFLAWCHSPARKNQPNG
jgi:O-antigen/teichoic acid export membrane protein